MLLLPEQGKPDIVTRAMSIYEVRSLVLDVKRNPHNLADQHSETGTCQNVGVRAHGPPLV